MTPVVLAAATDNIGPGATAFFIVLALIVAALVIFWALFGSLRRLKKSVASGAFEAAQNEHGEHGRSGEQPDPVPAATPRKGTRGDAGA